MKFEQLIDEMKKYSGLSEYYLEMLKSIGYDWEELMESWNRYTRVQEEHEIKSKLTFRLLNEAKKLGGRLGYIFQCIRKDSEKEYEKYKTDEEGKNNDEK